MLAIILLLVGLFIISLGGFIWAIQESRGRGLVGVPSLAIGIVSFIGVVTASFIWPITYLDSVGKIAEMEAFYNETLSAYEYAVSATDEIEINGAEPGIIDIAHQQQAVATSERIKELRDAVEKYNSRLAKYRRWNSTIIITDMFADPPEYLQFIRIGEGE